MKDKKLGAVLKKLWTEKGYTVGGVADQLRINESILRNYELGNRLPRIHILYGLSQIYKLSVDDIIKNTIKWSYANNFIIFSSYYMEEVFKWSKKILNY